MLLNQILNLILNSNKNQEIIMNGLNDLQAAVTALTTEVGQVKTAVAALNTQITQLQATIAAGGDSDVDVEAQAQAISAQVSALNAIVNPVTPSAPVATSAPAA